MQFFCPACQQLFTLEPETTVTTKQQQIAYKASCPICGQDLAAYGNLNSQSTTTVDSSSS